MKTYARENSCYIQYNLMGGAFMTMCGHLWHKWVGQLWQSKLSHLEICSTNAGLQVSTPSCHCMTTGFSVFELSTCGLLQKGWDHYPAKGCFYLSSPALG